MVEIYPVGLKKEEKSLTIVWSDEVSQSISIVDLRKACPCSACRKENEAKEAREAASAAQTPDDSGLGGLGQLNLNVLKPEELLPLQINGMKPVGNYGYSIDFSDGHRTGIFSFDLLRSLGEASSAP